MTFECHYCGATFRDFTGLVRHFEERHRGRDEYIVLELTEEMIRPATEPTLILTLPRLKAMGFSGQ